MVEPLAHFASTELFDVRDYCEGERICVRLYCILLIKLEGNAVADSWIRVT